LHQIKTPHKVWIGIALGFIGIALILRPSPLVALQPSLLGLASGITAAGSIITIRFMTKSIPVLSILFYNFLIGTAVSAILLPFAWIPFDNETLIFLICVGIFGSIYYFLSTISYAKAPVRITSSLSFLQIIFGLIADWLIWNHTPDWISILGIVAVILGGVLTIYYGQKELVTKKPT
jgi:drug/metabolite transporter (DMT)-like permease